MGFDRLAANIDKATLKQCSGRLDSSLAAEKPTLQFKYEMLLQQFHGGLDEKQRAALCLGWDDFLRLKVDNN
jgi:hypothetical protein